MASGVCHTVTSLEFAILAAGDAGCLLSHPMEWVS